ncbi:hypothetical protein PHYPSEUDO_003962 [Phytophthora pseudosyringae]|uniref:Uncharacterized protein n=1 Tax=Phytophthora pseudosyringae TaxID=221518 RepID=A0A8T1VP90_9STRA|nr:hypothetical protein PHYPSEUDO_003962 [Phytophthora pseudosyringae]
MIRQYLLLAVALVSMMLMRVSAVTYEVQAWCSGTSCGGTPYNMFIVESSACVADESCIADTSSSNLGALSTICTADYMAEVQYLCGASPYIVMEVYRGYNCEDFVFALGYFASGKCEGSPGFSELRKPRWKTTGLPQF